MPTIFGTYDRDSFVGGEEADEIFGRPTRRRSDEGYRDNDTLDGGAGDDTIDGGAGVDSLIGGSGNDLIIDHNDDAVSKRQGFDINGGDGDDTIELRGVSEAREGVKGLIDGGAGYDTLEIRGMGGLGDLDVSGVETLLLRGPLSATAEQLSSFDEIRFLDDFFGIVLSAPGSVDLSGKLKAKGEIRIVGSERADQIVVDHPRGVEVSGNGGDDTLIGGAGDDWLSNSRGDSRLEGRAGDDWIEVAGGSVHVDGGEGDDIIYMDVPRSGLVIGGEGHDVVESSGFGRIDFSDVEFRQVEELRLRGEFLINPDTFDGIDLVKSNGTPSPTFRLASSGSFSLEEGFLGSFTVVGSAGEDRIEGSETYDVLKGAAGDDTLDGGGFKDRLNGGEGVDTVTYHASDAAVQVSLAHDFASGGTAEGDELANIENLVGSSHSDWLKGDRFSNRIEGGSGADTLDGGAGVDDLLGGDGDDAYFVNDVGDRVVELAGGGIDVVRSVVDFSLVGAAVETLILDGKDDLSALGNDLHNTIIGNKAANVIDGGVGRDSITGGGGADIFDFSTSLGRDNVDQIADFRVGEDTLRLHADAFIGLSSGKLPATAFFIGSAAADAGHRIIYNAKTGVLLFDQDGSGEAFDAVRFATLNAGLKLSNEDFDVI